MPNWEGRIYSEKKKTLKENVTIARLHQNKCFHHHGVILHELVSTKGSVRTHYLLHSYDAPTQHFNYSFKTGYKPTSSCRYFTFQLLRNSPDSNASIWNAKREKSVENHQNVSSIFENTGFAIKYVLYCVIYGWVENLHWWFVYARIICSLIWRPLFRITWYFWTSFKSFGAFSLMFS